MTYRSLWLMGLGFAAGCSSSSPSSGPTAANDAAPSSGEDAASSSVDSGGSPSVQDAAPMTCDAVSLAAPTDSGAPACFACIATQCVSQVAACSTDCECAPAFACLQMNSTAGSINSGYSACPTAVSTLMSGNAALTALTDCATPNCSSQCFGDGG